jgi:hypothetical protein
MFQMITYQVQSGIDFKPPAMYVSKKAANTILNTTLGIEKMALG